MKFTTDLKEPGIKTIENLNKQIRGTYGSK